MASQQLEMIFPSLLPSRMTKASAAEVGRALPDGQVQPFDVGSVPLAGVLRVLPDLIPSPDRTRSCLPLNTYHSIFPALLEDLAVPASRPKDSLNNLTIEFETIRRVQWNSGRCYAGKNVLEEGERVSIAPPANDRRRPEAQPAFDGGENPNRWMLLAADPCANLVGRQFTNRNLLNRLMVESTTRRSGFLQPAIHCIPGHLMDARHRGFVHTRDAHRSDFVKPTAAMREAIKDGKVSQFQVTLKIGFKLDD